MFCKVRGTETGQLQRQQEITDWPNTQQAEGRQFPNGGNPAERKGETQNDNDKSWGGWVFHPLVMLID